MMKEIQNIRTLSAIIIDDEAGAITVLVKLLERVGGVEVVATEQNPNLGLRHIMVMKPDIIFLDIQMEKKNGIALLKEIKELSVDSHVVIVSGYDDYTFEAFKHGASDYLVKPVVMEELERTLFRIAKKNNKGITATEESTSQVAARPEEDGVSIRLAKDKGYVLAADIVYLSASGSYTEIYIKGCRKEICTRGLWLLERELPAYFFRIHRSTVVNTRLVKSISFDDSTCDLVAGDCNFTLPISKANIEALNDYL